VYSVQGTANDSVLRAVEIGYVFLDDGTGLYTYQLWLKDPTTDVSGPMNAYLNCQGYYIFDTGVSDVAQGGAAPTNFNVGVVGILVDKYRQRRHRDECSGFSTAYRRADFYWGDNNIISYGDWFRRWE